MPVEIRKRLATCKLIAVLLVLSLAACSGGKSAPQVNAGASPGSAAMVAAGVTSASSVSGDGFYTVSGLIPRRYYAIHLFSLTGDLALYGYADPNFIIQVCQSNRAGTADEACSVPADDNGNAYFRVVGSGAFNFRALLAESHGSGAAPRDITAELPFNGSNYSLSSYYVVTGLVPGQRYTVALNNVIFNPQLDVYQHKAFDHPVCTSTRPTWEPESCDVAANFEGRLYIKVDTDNGSTLDQIGAYYTIGVTPAAGTELIFEGYADAPIDLTGRIPYAGQVNRRSSRYTIGNLTPGTRYEIRMDNPTADNQLWVFPGGQFHNALCTAGYFFSLPPRKWCVAQAPASGSLNIEVPFTFPATYTLDVVLAPVAEGTGASPKAITTPYDGQVDTTASYYVINGLKPNWNYQVVLRQTSHNGLTVTAGSSTAQFSGIIARTDANGAFFIKADGSSTNGNGAWFTLDLALSNNPEGSPAAPVDITASSPASPYGGQVDDRTSYYKIGGLVPGNYYMTHMAGYTSDVRVLVYDDSTLSGTAKCWFYPAPFTSAPENNHCLAPAPAGGVLYVVVQGNSSKIAGTKYKLWLAPSLLKSEGQSSPVPVAVGTPQAGMVSNYETDRYSYYLVSGLPNGASFKVALTDATDDVDLQVFSDATYATELCRSMRRGLADESCVATTVGKGGRSNKTLYIRVAAGAYPITTYDGASYTLTVTGGATPITNEGAAGAPLDVTGKLPHSGKVRVTVTEQQNSYYKVTALDPAQKYAVIAENPSEGVSVSVYADAAFTSILCADNSWFTPANRSCSTLPTASGELYVKVGSKWMADAFFTLKVVPAPVPEGTASAPVDLMSFTLPYAGQVDGTTSYYFLRDLTPGASYHLSAGSLTQRAQIKAYRDAFTGFLGQGMVDESITSVVAAANSSGMLYITVDGSYSGFGAFYNLDVRAAPQSQGSVAAPVAIALKTPYQGQKAYGSANSYYKISGLAPHSSHRVTLRNRTMGAWIRVYDGANFARPLCYGSYGDYRTGCAAAANHEGEMFIEIGDVGVGGFYDLYVP